MNRRERRAAAAQQRDIERNLEWGTLAPQKDYQETLKDVGQSGMAIFMAAYKTLFDGRLALEVGGSDEDLFNGMFALISAELLEVQIAFWGGEKGFANVAVRSFLCMPGKGRIDDTEENQRYFFERMASNKRSNHRTRNR